MAFMPSSTSLPSSANSGPRWSIVGFSIARNTRSGTFVGPGICRKWRPVWRDMDANLATVEPVRLPKLPTSLKPDAACGKMAVPRGGPGTTTMNAPVAPIHFHARGTAQAPSSLEQRLRKHVDGDVLFDAFSRGRYSTDASIYQIDPL